MTKDRFLKHLEELFLDDNEINTADVVEGAVMVEMQDGDRFVVTVDEV